MPQYMTTPVGVLNWKEYGGSGDLIVLVHGLGGAISNWDAVGHRFAELGRTVAFDLPGFGLSPPAADWELNTYIGAIRAFMAELGDSATLVGNSMGGLLSEMVASEHRELVDALVLISPATPARLPDPHIHWPTARRLLMYGSPGLGPVLTRNILRRHTPEELVRLRLEMVAHKPGRIPIDVLDSFHRLARVQRQLPWASRATPAVGRALVRRYFRKPSRFVAMIREIKAPTLVVHGLEDRIISPTWVEWMCSLRPDWELIQMEDTGHIPQLDAPVRLMGNVAPWLKRHGSPGADTQSLLTAGGT